MVVFPAATVSVPFFEAAGIHGVFFPRRIRCLAPVHLIVHIPIRDQRGVRGGSADPCGHHFELLTLHVEPIAVDLVFPCTRHLGKVRDDPRTGGYAVSKIGDLPSKFRDVRVLRRVIGRAWYRDCGLLPAKPRQKDNGQHNDHGDRSEDRRKLAPLLQRLTGLRRRLE